MTIGELLDAAVKLYRQRWKLFMGIAAFVLIPYSFIQSFLTRAVASQPFRFGSQSRQVSTDQAIALLIGVIFSLLLLLIIQPFLSAAFAKATSDVYLGGEPTVTEIYRFARGKIWSILLVSVLTFLTVMGGVLLLIVPGIIFAVRFAFGSIVVVLEDTKGTKAMGRSWRLSKGSFWKILGTLLLGSVLAGVLSSILQLPFTLAAIPAGSAGWVLRALGASLGSVVTRPFSAILAVLLYFDLRIRKEGLDLEIMARHLGSAQP